MTGTVLFMLLGLTSWSDYEKNVSWGVIVLYAGAISLGAVFKSSGAAKWLADSLINILTTFNIQEGLPLAILVAVIGALMTNLMSAGATVAVIGPVVLEMAVSSGTKPNYCRCRTSYFHIYGILACNWNTWPAQLSTLLVY